MTPAFHFKEFSVSDNGCGQKLSSDAVWLGSFALPPESGKILDIGCGCGILSLMMAQKSKEAEIHAVEINEKAASQARQNFENSQWATRLKVFNKSIQEFACQNPTQYPCIISNPPYFHHQLKSEDDAERQSKHADELCFADLCDCVARLLDESGRFWVIVPASESRGFLVAALNNGLYCNKMLTLLPKAGDPPLRNIFCLQKQLVINCTRKELVVRGKDNQLTSECKELTKDFYMSTTKI